MEKWSQCLTFYLSYIYNEDAAWYGRTYPRNFKGEKVYQLWQADSKCKICYCTNIFMRLLKRSNLEIRNFCSMIKYMFCVFFLSFFSHLCLTSCFNFLYFDWFRLTLEEYKIEEEKCLYKIACMHVCACHNSNWHRTVNWQGLLFHTHAPK